MFLLDDNVKDINKMCCEKMIVQMSGFTKHIKITYTHCNEKCFKIRQLTTNSILKSLKHESLNIHTLITIYVFHSSDDDHNFSA